MVTIGRRVAVGGSAVGSHAPPKARFGFQFGSLAINALLAGLSSVLNQSSPGSSVAIANWIFPVLGG